MNNKREHIRFEYSIKCIQRNKAQKDVLDGTHPDAQ